MQENLRGALTVEHHNEEYIHSNRYNPYNHLFISCVSCDYTVHANYVNCHSFDSGFNLALSHAALREHHVIVLLCINNSTEAIHHLDYTKQGSFLKWWEKHFAKVHIFGAASLVWSVYSLTFLNPNVIVFWSNWVCVIVWSFHFGVHIYLSNRFYRIKNHIIKFFKKLIKKGN